MPIARPADDENGIVRVRLEGKIDQGTLLAFFLDLAQSGDWCRSHLIEAGAARLDLSLADCCGLQVLIRDLRLRYGPLRMAVVTGPVPDPGLTLLRLALDRGSEPLIAAFVGRTDALAWLDGEDTQPFAPGQPASASRSRSTSGSVRDCSSGPL